MASVGDDRTGPEIVEAQLGSTPEKERLWIETVALAKTFDVSLEVAMVVADQAVEEYGSLDAAHENSVRYVKLVQKLVAENRPVATL